MLLTSQLRKTPWVKANLQTPKYARWNTFYCCACACAVHVFRNLNWIRVTIKHLTLNDWSRGEQWILFPENLNVSRDEVEGNIEIRGKQYSLFPKGPVVKWFVIQQTKTKAKFENRAEIPAITCNSGQHFAGNSELFHLWRHSFRNVARLWQLAGNSFIVRCHVTMN